MSKNTFRRQKFYAIRDFPPGCGTRFSNGTVSDGDECVSDDDRCIGVADQNYHRPKEDESIDLVMKKAGINVAPASGNVGIKKLVPAKRTFPPSCGSKVKPLSQEETVELVASQSKTRRLSQSFGNSHRMEVERNPPEKMSNVARPKNQTREVLSPREKVLKALNLFNMVFKELSDEKAARRKTGTSRIDYETRNVLMETNKQVNGQKRVGSVPGIEVGDEFQYKAEMNVIGLHFGIMGGIDLMNRGDLTLATSIVASEGCGYSDKFESDVVIYTGEGGHVMNKDQSMLEDQKLVRGNLALANSMSAKTEVRVIRGIKREDQKGKHYVYDGLYLVEDYWQERGPLGNMMFKFKLCRVPGQPPVDWKKRFAR